MRDPSENEARIIESLTAIRDLPDVRIEHETVGELLEEEADTDIFRFVDGFRNVTLSPRLRDSNIRITEFSCRWRSPGEGVSLGGEFFVRDVFESLILPPPRISDDDTHPVPPSRLRVIDFPQWSGSGYFAALHIREHVESLDVWFCDDALRTLPDKKSGFAKMNLDYGEYLDSLAITKGVFGWQLLFTEVSLRGPAFRHHSERLKKMLDTFPAAFPQHDYSDLRTRLEARL